MINLPSHEHERAITVIAPPSEGEVFHSLSETSHMDQESLPSSDNRSNSTDEFFRARYLN
jgi:hypothetical protein